MIFSNYLGFILLIAIVILLLIYLIKPIYQNKVLSTNFIWNETLKRNHKKNPISKLRNLIIIIMQLLMITISSIIITKPLIISESSNNNEYVVILDASADMLAQTSDVTRFQRAVSQIIEKANEITKVEGYFSLILSDLEASYYIVQENDINSISTKLELLLNNFEEYCSFGSGNIDGAVTKANSLLSENSSAQLFYYTATNYIYDGDAIIIDVSNDTEWNSAILNVSKELTENTYDFTVDVATYNANKSLFVTLNGFGVNDELTSFQETKEISCFNNVKSTVTFSTNIYEYDKIEVKITTTDNSVDSFSYDNIFVLFGGRRENIKIQYASTSANNFFDGSLLALQNIYKNDYNITIYKPETFNDYKLSGFDFYIFEHTMPSYVPTDGVTLLVNPDKSPSGFDLTFSNQNNGNYTLTSGVTHEIMNYITPSNITATTYKKIDNTSGYDVLMTIDNDPVFVTKNTKDSKVSVLSLNLNTSNLALLIDFPVLVSNMFNYYFPNIIDDVVYEVYEDVNFNLRNENGSIYLNEEVDLSNQTSIKIGESGIYTITQNLLSGKILETSFFVNISQSESDFSSIQDLSMLLNLSKPSDFNKDILLYLSISLLACLVIEKTLSLKQQN